jgi:nitrite reductase/ring-hydroxylating ferredoxin subunit
MTADVPQARRTKVTSDVSNLQLRNPWSWYPVVASADLGPGTVLPVILNGEKLAVWRSGNGKVNAWRDRCPHRGMRLSFGAVHGETLICPYHGWTFGDDAHCVRIPAHPNAIPSRAARARLFPVAELDGHVWVCSGEPAQTKPNADSAYFPVRTLHLQLSMEDAIVAFLTLPCANGVKVRPPEHIEWSTSNAGALVTRSDALTATFALPSSVFCEAAAESGKGAYLIRVQPTDPGCCAVQASMKTGGDAVAFNRALVAFRAEIAQDEVKRWLRSASSKFGAAVPVLLDGLTQGEAP